MKVVRLVFADFFAGRKTVVPCLLVLILFSFTASSQEMPIVKSTVDTTAIKIGEQINFTVKVTTDTTAQVIFPEGQTFSPLETVEAFKTDTTREKDRMTLQRSYALTQFDSGNYLLPKQRIEIDGRGFFTDSLLVSVSNVPVDTTVQKMYDIKPLIEVERGYSDFWKTLLIILVVLGIIGAIWYYFFARKKPLTEEEKEAQLPPYDRALLELKKLENSRYLIQDEYKKYYSELTGIVRSYLEEEVQVSALESTTQQLIEKLELMKDAGKLELDQQTIAQFNQILQTADLVKFAKSKPATSVAENDRNAVEEIVIKTKEAIPEPTEEELLQIEEYKQELASKKKKRRLVQWAAAAVIVILVSSTVFVVSYGPKKIWDSVTAHPTKMLLEGEWIASDYGYPPVNLETPVVLLRQLEEPTSNEKIKERHTFSYTSPKALLSIKTTSMLLAETKEPAYDSYLEEILKEFENEGARNLITKNEVYKTRTGVEGVKVYGTGQFSIPGSSEKVRGEYAIYLFGGNGFQQQIILVWSREDTYAEEIINRVQNSIDVKTEV